MTKLFKAIIVTSLSLLALALVIVGGQRLLYSYRSRCRSYPPLSSQPVPGRQNGKITVAGRYLDPLSQAEEYGLAVIAPDGTVEQFIVTDVGADYPSWSPDGAQLAFSAFPDYSGFREIFVRDMQTESIRALSRAEVNGSDLDAKQQILVLDMQTGSVRQLTREGLSNWDPDWAPGADYLVYAGEIDIPGKASYPGYGNDEIYTINSDGSALRRLTTNEAGDFLPAVAPDGSAIAFVSNRDGDNEIYTMDPAGKSLKRLTMNSGSDVSPAWSPDGKWIVFASNRSGQWEIYTMEQDGSNQCPLTNSLDLDREPDWSPDGQFIAFISEEALAIVRTDGTGEAHILESEVIRNMENPAWQNAP